eukprot:354968-Chlamydomonas_euryale.AAC.6
MVGRAWADREEPVQRAGMLQEGTHSGGCVRTSQAFSVNLSGVSRLADPLAPSAAALALVAIVRRPGSAKRGRAPSAGLAPHAIGLHAIAAACIDEAPAGRGHGAVSSCAAAALAAKPRDGAPGRISAMGDAA